MSDTFSLMEIITGIARRRRFTTEQKLAVVAETMQLGLSISYIARRHGLSPSLVFRDLQVMRGTQVDRRVSGTSRTAYVHVRVAHLVNYNLKRSLCQGLGMNPAPQPSPVWWRFAVSVTCTVTLLLIVVDVADVLATLQG
jgi:transposase-like protein